MNDNILLDALHALNKKLEEHHIERLDLKVCGGFAMYRFTDEMTRDIDNTFALSQQLKGLVEQISEEFEEGTLDDDWLNDDWGKFGGKSWQALQIDKSIKWEPRPEIVLSHLTVTFAQLSSLICMKYFAIIERSKPKDVTDLQRMMAGNHVTAEQFLQMLKDHGIKNELDDVVSNLYLYKIIDDSEYLRMLEQK